MAKTMDEGKKKAEKLECNNPVPYWEEMNSSQSE
jgi:hypothetical protein